VSEKIDGCEVSKSRMRERQQGDVREAIAIYEVYKVWMMQGPQEINVREAGAGYEGSRPCSE
jgi:hypothetical protein